ncbi:MAG: hypothetical protein ACP5ER_00575 [Candidatus Bathyarchaeales archaeon]
MTSREDISTTTKIAEILEMLNDGKWHTLEEIQQKTKMDKNQIQPIIEFLEEYNFIVMDEAKKKIKLDKTVQKFLTHATTS